jgi:ribosomal protein S16
MAEFNEGQYRTLHQHSGPDTPITVTKSEIDSLLARCQSGAKVTDQVQKLLSRNEFLDTSVQALTNQNASLQTQVAALTEEVRVLSTPAPTPPAPPSEPPAA